MKRIVLCVFISLIAAVVTACKGPSNVSEIRDRQMVESILSNLDDLSLTPEQQLDNYLPDAVILAPEQKEIRGREALHNHLTVFGSTVDLILNHQIVELTSFENVVVAQGKVVGTAQPKGDVNRYPFETKNIILFKRQGPDDLKIWKVIYNSAPVAD